MEKEATQGIFYMALLLPKATLLRKEQSKK